MSTITYPKVSRAGLVGAAALAFLSGTFIQSFAQVMWVEDQVLNEPAGDQIVDLVAATPPVMAVLQLIALAVLVASIVLVVRRRMRNARQPLTA